MTAAITKVTELEALAEAAYEAMFDARPCGVKDFYDDAMRYLTEAAAEAERLGSVIEIDRLEQRRQHEYDVYHRQFRGIG